MAKSIAIHSEDGLTAETVVGHTVKIEGDLVSEGDIKVDGTVTGKIKTTKNLFVGPTAKIEADVDTGAATVAGELQGNLKVGGLLVVLQTGQITGDIECQKLAIEEGAYFSGSCKMIPVKDRTIKAPIEDEE